jgi:hypothetical protein
MTRVRPLHLLIGAAFVASLALGFSAAKAETNDKVGVAAAVNPDAFSNLNGSAKKQINIGKSIFYNERIDTSGSGLVQVLLLDGSTFTVGPGSDLVIDKFVYDPNKKSGQIVASFSKGVLRFIGGKISKNENGVSVNTPAGALAIRGGIFQGYIGHHKMLFSFLYGYQLVLNDHGHIYRVYQPGFTIDFSGGHPHIRHTEPGDTYLFMQGLRGRGRAYALGHDNNDNADQHDQPGGSTGRQSSNNVSNDFITFQTLNTDATTSEINQQIQEQQNQSSPGTHSGSGGSTPGGTPGDTTGDNTGGDNTGGDTTPKVGGEFEGYAAGFAISQTTTYSHHHRRTQTDIQSVMSYSPKDVKIVLNPETNTAWAGISVYGKDQSSGSHRGDDRFSRDEFPSFTKYEMSFGGDAASAYDDDNSFAAEASAHGVHVTNFSWGYNWNHGWGYKADHQRIWDADGAVASSSFTNESNIENPSGLPADTALCRKCDYIKWGAWTVSYRQSGYGDDHTHVETTGYWVAGALTPVDQLPTSGTAKYAGSAIGIVDNHGQRYSARGDMIMNWYFARQRGDLTISNFDNRTFGTGAYGLTQIPNVNQFGGNLYGAGLRGSATGSFVSNGATPAAGVIGNWDVANHYGSYQANGIFGAKIVP